MHDRSLSLSAFFRLGSSSVSTTSSTSTTLTSTVSLRGLNTYRDRGGLSSYKQRLEEYKEDYRSSLPARLTPQPSTTASSTLTPGASVTTAGLTTGTTTSISSSTITSPYSNYQFKRWVWSCLHINSVSLHNYRKPN